MKKIEKIYFICILLFVFLTKLNGQTVEELGEKLKSASTEEKAYLLNKLAEISLAKSAEKSISYADLALQAATQTDDANEKTAAFENLANGYQALGNHKKAIPYFQNAANGYIRLKQYQSAGFLLSNLADAQLADGKPDEAVNANKQAISQYNLAKDKKNASACLMNIGDIYLKQKNFQEAINSYKPALKSFDELKDKDLQIHTLTRLGSAYSNWGNYEEALANFTKALNIASANKMDRDAAEIQKNIEIVKNNKNNFSQSQTAYDRQEKTLIVNEVQNQKQQINSLSAQTAKSVQEIEKLSIENQVKEYKIKAQQDELTYQKLQDLEKNREIQLLTKDKELKEISIQKQRQIILFIVITLLLLAVFAVFISRWLVVTRKQKALIHKQKILVDTKNNQITDSIKAALPIQESILPKTQIFKTSFTDAFVLFLPKDIVSGDFYWIKNLGNEILFAVIDCTGHGVPGAFMSLHAYNQLEYIVTQKNILVPALILDELNKGIVNTLKEESDREFVKSGMDMSLVKLNKLTGAIDFSGAKNDLVIIRNKEITELKSNPLTIGNLLNTPYINHTFEGKSGDMLYMFSDGYKDQKGGPKNKSLYSAPFKQLLQEVSHLTCLQQQILLQEKHLEWKKNNTQLDDICIMGVKL